MEHIKLGIIGAGRIGKLHAENLKNLPQVKIKAISDLFADTIKDWAASCGIENVSKDYQSIIQDEEIDAILICSPTDTHISIIKEAAEAGKHIFCEKPISFNLQETAEIVELVQNHGVKFQTGFNRRFDHNMSRVQELVRAGKIGDPHLLKITSRDPAPPHPDYIPSSGGLFIDMAIHDFDLARFMMDSDVVEVYAQGAVLIDQAFAKHNDVDTATISLRFANGALGVIDNSRKAHYYDQRVEVFGSEGCLNIQNDFPNSAELYTSEGVFKDKPLYFFLERYNNAYIKEIEAFVDAIVANNLVPVTANDGYQAELIAHAAKLSLKENRPVALKELAAL
ncbi:inositol 2-dehydrogenase [Paenibacillus sp. GCM10012307]|uniref:Inositol 2-dehydrogenase n=1 Tax=Paenibacillus roseus TaxID=2798579 RepID=A0A934J655_9BACL|nr:inositol 2-dehydrogenase [Paenibacillus roseus]MBJ6362449.1 inositol 2-dehydrogenase [Paenibacillus roseus]